MKRYTMSSGQYGPGVCEVEDDDGEWVRYDDVAELFDRLFDAEAREQAMQEAIDEEGKYSGQEMVPVSIRAAYARKLEERRRGR